MLADLALGNIFLRLTRACQTCTRSSVTPTSESTVPNSLRRNVSVLTVVATLLLVGTIGLLVWLQFDNSHQARFWVYHTEEVISAADELGFAVRDAETGQRGYLLTGRADYLAPYTHALERIAALQIELLHLTADNPGQQTRLNDLALLIQRKLDELAQTVALRHDLGFDAALRVVQSNLGLGLMSQIVTALRSVRGTEERLLDERRQDLDRTEVDAIWFASCGAIFGVALLALAGRLLAETHKQKQVLEANAEQLALVGQIRTAFDSVSQGIAVFADDGHALRWNQRFPSLLGLPDPLMRSGTSYEAVAEQLAAGGTAFLETDAQIRDGRGSRVPGEAVVYERTRAADDRSFELRRTAMPNGGFVLTVTDTTEQVRAEASARGAQRMQAMGQLTGGIAHDFNNLLTVILSNLELARDQSAPASPVLRYIEQAIRTTMHGATLNRQLLTFARRQPLTLTPIVLSEALSDAADLLRRTLGEHIGVEMPDAAGLWPAMADRAQVETALLNLALNARDAMPGGGWLTIEVANKVLDYGYTRQHVEVIPGDYVMLAVSDTGTGMLPDVLARAFEPFFTTKPPGMGTGLGLAMVFAFAKQSGGHLQIYSEPGEGTTVRLYLPRATGFDLAEAHRDAAPVVLPRGSATILVVEDDTDVRAVTVEILCGLGYRVLQAPDGATALRVFGQKDANVDLLLADIMLPGGMKGDEVARRLAEVRPGLRILFMSGFAEHAMLHHGRLDEGVKFISKPFPREHLACKVAETLGTLDVAATATGESRVVDLVARDGGCGD
jgi:signal transduction histidine kinase/FixJ family two-component response regulator